MGYVDYLKKGFEILKLDRKTISEVASDQEATKWGVVTVVLTYLILGFLFAFLLTAVTLGMGAIAGPFLLVVYPIMGLVGLFLGAGVVYLVAKLFGGQGTYMDLVRTFGLISMANVVSFIPLVNFLVGIWLLVVAVITISETQKLSVGKAVGVIVVLAVLGVLLSVLLAGAFIATLLGGAALAAK